MLSEDFIYMLRLAIQPGHYEAERLDTMADFCKKARIDDVMFFIDCEELNQGHLTLEDAGLWLDVIRRGKNMLEPLGITTSINPWPTLLHGDRGRSLKKGQNFNLMTDPYGNKASAVACPLCEEWRGYITEIYAYYASIQPFVLWIEDDFRLHNHGPLIWGGCFCDKHMEEYSRRAGKKLERVDFLEGILKPEYPHPYRKIWLDTSRDVMLENAVLIGNAVSKVSPSTRVGLMSSNPPVHCAEGRDWEGILKGLAAKAPMVNRPHLPAYNDVHPQGYLKAFTALSKLTCSVIPGATEVFPELESFPHSRFSKSKALTRFQLETSLILGADGITLNIFDMMGNGVLQSEGYQEVLSDVKDYLTGIKRLGLKLENQGGVKVPISVSSSYTLHTSEGRRMEELYPREEFWAPLLSCYSVANTYTLEKEHKGEIVAVSGQYFRNLDEYELRQLFENNFVILEGEAASTLMDMGFGELAGIRNASWHKMDSGFQAYEEVCNGKKYCGIEKARISSQAVAGDFLEINYYEGIELTTVVKNPFDKPIAPGMAIFREKVLILPYGKFNENYQSHLTPIRQAIFQEVLRNCKVTNIPLFVEGEPYVAVYPFNKGNTKALILMNASLDAIKKMRIFTPLLNTSDIMELDRSGKIQKAHIQRDGEYVILEDGMRAMELKVLVT